MIGRTFRSLVQLAALVAAVSLSPRPAAAQNAADDARYPCRAVHTFDFWVGTFDAMPWDKPEAPPAGQLRNTREYEGCVFVERWTSPGQNGMSIVFYDVTLKTWRMVWDDDSNSSTVFSEGSYHDGAMRFFGWKLDPKGNPVYASNVLENVSPGVIHHIFSTSADSRKTWTVRSNGRFVRRKE